MITLVKRINGATETYYTVCLPWEQRVKSRLRVRLDSGEEAGIFMPRGTVLRGGDMLSSEEGSAVMVLAAAEMVSTVRTGDPLLLARICYHLGNRHVALEIGKEYARYLHDHVLDQMVQGLGGDVELEKCPFEPEYGAYGDHGDQGDHGGHGGHDGHSHGNDNESI
jgi:urease accessory protein